MPILRSLAGGLLAAVLLGCGGDVEPGDAGQRGGVSGPEPLPAWAGGGFVVHEWGTNTIVVGSDGSLQIGLHHEEEGLPEFVYDRMRAAPLVDPANVVGPEGFDCKLETPVTYFYSDTQRSVNVAVRFPEGVYSQWYPAVSAFNPPLVRPCLDPAGIGDPYLDSSYPFVTAACPAKFPVRDGLLDWGNVEILAPDTAVELPNAPPDRFTWAYARNVQANPIRAGYFGETERFLFYRGLGSSEMPLRVTARAGGELSLANTDGDLAMGAVFVLNVGEDRAAFVTHSGGVAARETLSARAPSLDGAPALEDYARGLADAMAVALAGTGLYEDEARAMIDTWKRQWFDTPGMRVLYLLPQAWTERIIPLTIAPAPDVLVRTLVVRVEVLTPELEAVDVEAARGLAGDDAARAAGEAHFVGLGRFAEPRLRRALALIGEPGAFDVLLSNIARGKTTLSVGG